MVQQNITLISFGYFEESFLKEIAAAVKNEYPSVVRIKDGHLDLSEFFDPTRRQYNGTKLLKEIDQLFSADHTKTIGLFSIDLFIPILTYIFGQAILSGRTGIASHYRLNNERYGLAPDTALLIKRFEKEVIHELGHTFGLVHCHTPDCVMRSSTYAEDIDQKGNSLCRSCQLELDNLMDAASIKPKQI
jgi:archaemetzincin